MDNEKSGLSNYIGIVIWLLEGSGFVSDTNKKLNYLEQEIRVRLVDGLLERSQEWQWFVDIVENTFTIEKVASWSDYQNNNHVIKYVYNNFIAIQKICTLDWIFQQKEFEEIWLIAKFYLGGLTVEECARHIDSVYGKVMLFCVWITKLGNSDGKSEATYNIQILLQCNLFELIDLEPFSAVEDQLIGYAKEIELTGFDDILACLEDNISQIEHPCDQEFINEHKSELFNYNTFSFQLLSGKNIPSWQEKYLLDMCMVSIRDRELIPITVFNGVSTPDISLWTAEVISKLKTYFENEITDYVLDTINYIYNGVPLPAKTILNHCSLLSKALSLNENINRIEYSSSFLTLSYVFKDKMNRHLEGEREYRQLLSVIHNITDPNIILILKTAGYPVTKEQKKLAEEYCKRRYESITEVDDLITLLGYLEDKYIISEIPTEFLGILSEKFNMVIKTEIDVRAATVFYEYMVFLINVNLKNQNIDKRVVNREMIRVQELWEKSFYPKVTQSMCHISHETAIPEKGLKRWGELFLLNPIVLAINCVGCAEEQMLQLMESVSERAIMSMCNKIRIDPQFPIGGESTCFLRHDIDQIHLEIFEKISREKGYKLLNAMEPELYVEEFHNRIKFSAQFVAATFQNVPELYEEVKNNADFKLMEYSKDLSLAMVTQLFPLLEIKIRKLAKLFGIFPYKKNLEDFMQCNDPSSLLREILSSIYEISESFENVSDLLFVYHTMYNSNSLNIRNECIHGRDYIYPSRMKLAFVTTLFAIHMINFRIRTIEANQSDILDYQDKAKDGVEVQE